MNGSIRAAENAPNDFSSAANEVRDFKNEIHHLKHQVDAIGSAASPAANLTAIFFAVGRAFFIATKAKMESPRGFPHCLTARKQERPCGSCFVPAGARREILLLDIPLIRRWPELFVSFDCRLFCDDDSCRTQQTVA